MKAVLLRTGSAPALSSPVQDTFTGILSPSRNSARSCLHMEGKEKKKDVCSVRRTMSEANVLQSVSKTLHARSRSFPARIVEEEEGEEEEEGTTLVLKKRGLSLDSLDGIWRGSDVLRVEKEFSGGDIGRGNNNNNNKVGGGNSGNGDGGLSSGGNSDQSNMSNYYEKMLKGNPGNALILTNYAKFLHEVKGDYVKAEECYARAILANPGDGELLSLYGKLIWDSCRDGERAQSYFDQAVQASPDDCYVMGSYANFLWNSEEDEEEEDISGVKLGSTFVELEAC